MTLIAIMKYKLFPSLALVTLGITAMAPSAFANPTVGRETRTGDIYVSGLGSYQSIKGEYSSLPRSTNKNANECGVIKLSGSSASLPINAGDTFKLNGGADIAFNSLVVEAEPKCSNGVLVGNPTPSATLKDSNGNVYFTGLTPYSSNVVTYNNAPTLRSVKASTCGTARFSNSGKYVVTSGSLTITDSATGSTIVTIPDVGAMTAVSGGPICRNGATFTTADWPSP
jgi:hypothetical protein